MGGIRRRLGRYKRSLLRQVSSRPTTLIDARTRSLDDQSQTLDASRRLGMSALMPLFEFLESVPEKVLTVREAARLGVDTPPRVVMLRHDIDADLQNALRLAALEEAAGLRASYFVLHSAWYYRWQSGDEISGMTLDALHQIRSMGHEIGLHNNAIGVAIRTGRDPVEILSSELEQLRSHGFDIAGTAAHGDGAVLRAGLLNHQIFAERGTDAISVETSGRKTITFEPQPLASFDLEYEAYSTPSRIYLTDSGGRWNSSPQWALSQFERGLGPLSILIHPEAPALTDKPMPLRKAPGPAFAKHVLQPATPPTPIRAREENRPMRIVGRSDCCCRRAVFMNLDLFGGKVDFTRDEKSRSDFLFDHASVGSPTRSDVLRYVAVERIGDKSQRHYEFCQTDRATMTVRDADLIVLDSYGDMNFQAWQHRVHGWKLWVPIAFLRDRARFEIEFQSVGYLSLDESVAFHVALIEFYRRMNGHIPVLFLTQPIAYFDKLDHRAEFRQLGDRLEQQVPDVFHGVIDDSDLEPDDMGSSGPGQTLHFTGPTYRRMIDVAMEKGLSAWMPPITQPSRG